MPSNGQSWWARHCTPPPPISAASSCPCGSCYNKSIQDAAQLEMQHFQAQQLQIQLQQQQRQQEQQQQQQRRTHLQDQHQQHKTQRSGKAWGEKPMRMMDSKASLLLKKDSDSMSIASSFSEGSIYHLENVMDHQ